jgi:hypothetical protein
MRTESITEKNISPAIVCIAPWRLNKLKALENYRLEVEFIDGTRGFVEMKQLIMSQKAGMFAKLADINIFNQVHIEYGVVTWPYEIDLAPDAMYDEIKKNGIWILK